MSDYKKTDRAFDFLSQKEREDGTFMLSELAEASGWSINTVYTYFTKNWRHGIISITNDKCRVDGVLALGREGFRKLQSQRRTPPPSPALDDRPVFDYEVALSFAGEDRDYVEQVAGFLKSMQLSVFYDRYEQANLWGKNLYEHLSDVYMNRAKYCILFVSAAYKEKLWTNHERESAQARAFHEKGEYILPARFDDTEIPGIPPTICYVDLRQVNPVQLGKIVLGKLKIDTEVADMLGAMRAFLTGYSVELKDEMVVFDCPSEDFISEYPLSILLHMYREGWLEYMFLDTGMLVY